MIRCVQSRLWTRAKVRIRLWAPQLTWQCETTSFAPIFFFSHLNVCSVSVFVFTMVKPNLIAQFLLHILLFIFYIYIYIYIYTHTLVLCCIFCTVHWADLTYISLLIDYNLYNWDCMWRIKKKTLNSILDGAQRSKKKYFCNHLSYMNPYQDGYFDVLCAGFEKWSTCYVVKHSACRGGVLNSPAVNSVLSACDWAMCRIEIKLKLQ